MSCYICLSKSHLILDNFLTAEEETWSDRCTSREQMLRITCEQREHFRKNPN